MGRRDTIGRQGGAQRLDRPVGVGGAGGEGAEQARCARVVGAQPRHLLERHHARGQCPRLVGAEDVDVAQALHRVELLHQHVLAQQPYGSERVGERDAQHEPVGDQRQDHGGHAHALHERHPADDVAHPHQDLEHDDDDEQHADDLHHLALQRGELALVGRRLGGELVGEAVQADLRGLVVAAARHAEAARHEVVAGVLGHEVRLAGEQRLVHFHAPLADHRPVHDHLVAGLEPQHVTQHHQRRVDLLDRPVAQHVRLGPQQDRHLVHHALGADLLEQADDGVGGDHEHHGERIERLAQDQQQDAEEVEEVVDEVEDVVADDATVGAAGPDLDVVALAGRAAAVGLGGGEAGEPGGDVVGGGGHRRRRVPERQRTARSDVAVAGERADRFLPRAGRVYVNLAMLSQVQGDRHARRLRAHHPAPGDRPAGDHPRDADRGRGRLRPAAAARARGAPGARRARTSTGRSSCWAGR